MATTMMSPAAPTGPSAARRPCPRPWRRFLAALAAVVLLAELAVRLAEPHLEPALAWPRADYVRHERLMAVRADDLRLLVLGSSVAGRALAPDALTAAGGPGPGYNYWLAGASMRSISLLATEVLLRRVTPEVVVIGVTMREMNDGPAQRGHREALEQSPAFRAAAGRAGLIDRLDDGLQAVSALARRRQALRDPGAVVADLRAPVLVPEQLAPDGSLAERGDARLADEPAEHVAQERTALADYTVSDGEVAALGHLLDTLRAQGTRVLVVNLPVTDQLVALADDGRADYERYLDAVRSVTVQHHARWLDAMTRTWRDEEFADIDHLNDRGRAALAPLVLEALEPMTAPVPGGLEVRGASGRWLRAVDAGDGPPAPP